MSLNNDNVVDAIGIDKASGSTVLTIADSSDWINENDHPLDLQNKLNAYLAFIESGQIRDVYPDSVGRKLVIDVVSRFPLPSSGITLLNEASRVASQLGVVVTTRIDPG